MTSARESARCVRLAPWHPPAYVWDDEWEPEFLLCGRCGAVMSSNTEHTDLHTAWHHRTDPPIEDYEA